MKLLIEFDIDKILEKIFWRNFFMGLFNSPPKFYQNFLLHFHPKPLQPTMCQGMNHKKKQTKIIWLYGMHMCYLKDMIVWVITTSWHQLSHVYSKQNPDSALPFKLHHDHLNSNSNPYLVSWHQTQQIWANPTILTKFKSNLFKHEFGKFRLWSNSYQSRWPKFPSMGRKNSSQVTFGSNQIQIIPT